MKTKIFRRAPYLRKLSLVDFTRSLYPDTDLKDTYLICAQHLVSTTYSMFSALIQMGLKPENLAALGKCYSTDPTALKEMQKLGIDACNSSLAFDSHHSFDEQYRESMRKFVLKRLNRLNSNKLKRIIVLDDGGELISAISALKLPNELKGKIIGIEQTSSGYRKLKSRKVIFPIINVARSPAKLNYESPIIAGLVVDTLVSQIKNLPLQPKEVLIIGNGAIGSQIYETLKGIYNISIFDKAKSKSSIKKEDFEKSLKKFDLIIGCTGSAVLRPEHYRLLKRNVVLVSASSSDREFNGVCLRKKVPSVTNCHETLLVDGIYLINCGFPINFSSEFRAIDSDKLQLTRSLLLAAVLQAANHSDFTKKGFIALDIENQRDIVQKYRSIFTGFESTERDAVAV